MYKLMIVDDDRLVRERILSAIPMQDLEIELCAEAANGIQALEMFERFLPHIVILDINIPLMDGIEVAKQIVSSNVDTNIVIVTGFGTVEFARDAIHSGVVDFLLKPIDFVELENVLKKIIVRIQEESEKALAYQRMERLVERGTPLLRERFFMSLIHNRADQEDYGQYLQDFGIHEKPEEICVSIIVPDYQGLVFNTQMSMQAIITDELKNKLEPEGIHSIVVCDSMLHIVVIAYGDHSPIKYILEKKLSILRDKMRYIFRLDFRASIGSTVNGFDNLHESYMQAERSLRYASIVGENNVVSSENVENITLPNPNMPVMKYQVIMDSLVYSDATSLENTINRYFNDLVYKYGNTTYNLQSRAIELIALMISCAREFCDNIDSAMDEVPNIYVQIMSTTNVLNITRIIRETAAKLTGLIHGRHEKNKNRALGDAKRYIIQNYADPELRLEMVAAHVNLSPSYISQLFKKYDNCTFTDFLNSYRIEQAKRLLTTTHMRVYEVSNAVGYKNSKYFFELFKQTTGKRPREFFSEASQSKKT